MQFLFNICWLLVAVSAELVYPTNYDHDFLYADHYGHVNHQVGPHGVPHDTEEVAAAKAVHLAAHAEAKARLAYGYGAQNNEPIDTPEVQIAKFQHQIAHAEAKQRLVNPALAHAAVPVETPEVQIAKQEHFAAHAEAKLRETYPAFVHAAGPVDTLEVQQAKIEHFHAKAQAQVQQAYGYDHHQYQYTGLEGSHVHGGYDTPDNYEYHQTW